MARKGFSVNDMEQVSNEYLIAQSYMGSTREEVEPYDPSYLSDAPYEIPDVSSYEKRFYRKISIVEKKLRKNHIAFEWLEDHEMFRVGKKRQEDNGKMSGLLTYQYIAIYMDTNEYAFGGWEEDQIVSTRISDVIEVVKEWLSNNSPALR